MFKASTSTMVKKGVARTKNQFASMVFTKFTNEGIIYNQLHSAQRAKNLATFFATASRFALRKKSATDCSKWLYRFAALTHTLVAKYNHAD